MQISEIEDTLKDLKTIEGNITILGLSVNGTHITICYEDTDFNVGAYKTNYKDCNI